MAPPLFVISPNFNGLVYIKGADAFSFLQNISGESELRNVPTWKAHKLSGDRGNTWSLFVTKNWRLTFRVDHDEIEIVDLNYEDYH